MSNPAIAGYVACTSRHPFEIDGSGTARSGWTTWNLPPASPAG